MADSGESVRDLNEATKVLSQKLAGNDKTHRDRAIAKLRLLIEKRQKNGLEFSKTDMLAFWAGLHYSMWMCDKPVVQEKLADVLASLLTCFKDKDSLLSFIEMFFETENREWFNLDRWRVDKFMMLFRRVFRGSLELLRDRNWDRDLVEGFAQTYERQFLTADNSNISDELLLHFIDIFTDELEGVQTEDSLIPRELVNIFLHPFCKYLPVVRNKLLFKEVKEKIFDRVTKQVLELSEILDQHNESKHEEDCEESDDEIDKNGVDMEEDEDEDDNIGDGDNNNNNENGEDPKGKKDNVLMVEPLDYDLQFLASALKENVFAKTTYSVTFHAVFRLYKRFKSISEGELPNDLARDHSETSFNYDIRLEEEIALHRLQKFEKKVLKKDSKKRKKQKIQKLQKVQKVPKVQKVAKVEKVMKAEKPEKSAVKKSKAKKRVASETLEVPNPTKVVKKAKISSKKKKLEKEKQEEPTTTTSPVKAKKSNLKKTSMNLLQSTFLNNCAKRAKLTPKRKKPAIEEDSPSANENSKRKVQFALKDNKAQDHKSYMKSLRARTKSTDDCFNPSTVPSQGILKKKNGDVKRRRSVPV
ncbi:DgyrCDS436 [Dimorphilus gyrociliatus]|uniref:DgyrCDS436 n=1 Tax=Dimorphilus gyrociliatus TaxID=2664684 RepID=A0A7I8V7C0_9ANNE|nr:DgyrCDS436 [Dimorphilus gyrociliatus]